MHNDQAGLQGTPAAMPQMSDTYPTTWLRPAGPRRPASGIITSADVEDARDRLNRFAPVLAKLFDGDSWDGQVRSDLIEYPHEQDGTETYFIKADHQLPMTGTVKARGGVYELLVQAERLGVEEGLIQPGDSLEKLITPEAKAALSKHKVIVASTGNLGFSIGLVALRFGINAEIHMSRDAKGWKKERLVALGANVVEHPCDYEQASAFARAAATQQGCHFVDDERSKTLFVGYAAAARELSEQLTTRGIEITAQRPLVVYLPCGVGGMPGGITFGLRAIFGEAVFPVFVEPIASACVFAALARGGGEAVSVYDYGLDNETIADGLAVPRASELVLDCVGQDIDAAIALPDTMARDWVKRAWADARLKLEPSAAMSLAAIAPSKAALSGAPDITAKLDFRNAVHVAWATGGSLMPDADFQSLLENS